MKSHMLDIYLLNFYPNCGPLKHFICPFDAVWAAHMQAMISELVSGKAGSLSLLQYGPKDKASDPL